MKKNIILIISVLVIIAGIYAFKNLGDKKLSPERVVDSFYSDWLAYNGNPLVDELYKESPYLSENYKLEIEELLKSFDRNSYDPILCAQDKAESVEVKDAIVKDKLAIVLTEHYFSGGNNFVEIVLEDKNATWQIVDIVCPRQEISLSEKSLVERYIRDHISELSPEPAVLGGTFYVTDIIFLNQERALVDYEDGHIALTAQVDFSISQENLVEINSFEIVKDFDENFSKIGNIVEGDNNWEFVYEEPGKPALRLSLVFKEYSQCLDQRPDNSCLPAYWQIGDRVEISGIKDNESLIVKSLRVVAEASEKILVSPNQEIASFEDCREAGYEVLFPDCLDCLAYCETETGQRFEQAIESEKLICIDSCGNGICEEIVCLGSDCPCAETKENCPSDCN